jgi:pyroglutamyl-peptidase
MVPLLEILKLLLNSSQLFMVVFVWRSLTYQIDEVPSILASLWKKYDVKLCVHCGVGLTGPVRIEKRAHNFSYERLDNKKSAPFDGACVQGAARVLETSVNIKMLIESLPETPIDIVESTDAGRYLCEFTYFFSLHLFRAPVLFVHVPPFSEEVTLDSLSECISAVLLGAQSTLSLRLPGLLRPQVSVPYSSELMSRLAWALSSRAKATQAVFLSADGSPRTLLAMAPSRCRYRQGTGWTCWCEWR